MFRKPVFAADGRNFIKARTVQLVPTLCTAGTCRGTLRRTALYVNTPQTQGAAGILQLPPYLREWGKVPGCSCMLSLDVHSFKKLQS